MSNVPDFSKELLQNTTQRKFIFDIIMSKHEKYIKTLKDNEKENEENSFRDSYQSAVTFIYKIVAKSFESFNDNDLRNKLAETDFI